MRFAVLALLIIGTVLVVAQNNAPFQLSSTRENGTAVTAEIKRLEVELARAVVARDYDALRRIEADTYVYTGADAHVSTRDEFIEAYRSGKSQIPMLEFHDMKVDDYGHAAVVRGILTVQRIDNGVRLRAAHAIHGSTFGFQRAGGR